MRHKPVPGLHCCVLLVYKVRCKETFFARALASVTCSKHAPKTSGKSFLKMWGCYSCKESAQPWNRMFRKLIWVWWSYSTSIYFWLYSLFVADSDIVAQSPLFNHIATSYLDVLELLGTSCLMLASAWVLYLIPFSCQHWNLCQTPIPRIYNSCHRL